MQARFISLIIAIIFLLGAFLLKPNPHSRNNERHTANYEHREGGSWGERSSGRGGERGGERYHNESRSEASGEAEEGGKHAFRVEDTTDRQPAPLDENGGHPEHRNLQHLQKDGYTIEYDNELKGPAEVNYKLNWSTRSSDKLRRPQTPFATDEETSAKVSTSDYAGSGYDRGHMCPSFAMGAFHGRDAQIGTFICSNILPQTHLCNAGVWNSIERMESDDFAKRFGEVSITDGPVYNATPEQIRNHIAIPAAFYKIIERPDHKIIVFLVPQIPKSTKPEDYLTSLQHVRDLTGLNLLPKEPQEEANQTRNNIW